MDKIEEYNLIGQNKVRNKIVKTLVLSILAGFLLSIAGYLSIVSTFKIDNTSISKIISGLTFPVGLFFIVILKAELFTGNSLLVIPLINKKIKVFDLLKNWVLVYLGNMIGSIVFACLISNSGLIENLNLSQVFLNLANVKLSYTFINAFILGILCNIMVCLAVYLSATEKSIINKVIYIFIPIFTFVALSFEHSVANMFYFSMSYILGKTSLVNILLNNLLPVTLGNIVGGVLLGIVLNYINKK